MIKKISLSQFTWLTICSISRHPLEILTKFKLVLALPSKHYASIHLLIYFAIVLCPRQQISCQNPIFNASLTQTAIISHHFSGLNRGASHVHLPDPLSYYMKGKHKRQSLGRQLEWVPHKMKYYYLTVIVSICVVIGKFK